MKRDSAGILVHRRRGAGLEVLLVHPGGPFWARKDLGAWSIPKGEIAAGEVPEQAARRELHEETGLDPAALEGPLTPLSPVRQAGGKTVWAWAARGDFDPDQLRSSTCTIEWPPRSGRRMEIPEVDRAAWFSLEEARRRILASQRPFLDQLASTPSSTG
jgi:predicted NUDIX family NTP pyrophosphohydrolase